MGDAAGRNDGMDGESAPAPPVGMQAAVQDFEQGRFEEAAQRLRKLEGKADPIEDYRLYYLAESLFLAGRYPEALEALDDLSTHRSSRFAVLVAWRRADVLLASGDASGAARAYLSASKGGIPDEVDSASVHLNWARALHQAGRTEAARSRYRIAMLSFPHRPQADQAMEALAELEPGWTPSFEDRIQRADRLMDLKRYEAAEKELSLIDGKLPAATAREVAYKKAKCVYLKRRHWHEAQKLFEPLGRGKDDIAAQSAYMVARCLHKRGLSSKAVAAYRKFLDRFKHSSLRDNALMHLMVIDYEAGHFDRVHEHYLPLLRSGTWSGDSRASALWMIAFSAHLVGKNELARDLMDEYQSQATTSMSRTRSAYWGAVVRLRLGQEDEAARRLTELATGYPLHYYALLAMRRLEQMDRELPGMEEIIGPPPPEPGPGCLGVPPVVRVLGELSMEYDARQEMMRRADRVLEAHADHPAALSRIFGCAGAQKVLIRHAPSLVGEQDGEDPATHVRWSLLYPMPYRQSVEKHAEKSGVPPMLAMAIIRQESMFDPDATSVVRASGLMQLMPATGEQVARELDVAWSEDLLFDPETNIRFGTHYLGGLISRFPNNLPAAVGAYNGGPHNVKRWLDSHAPVDGDVFVELVPFAQTRNYIRRVLTSYARYSYLNTGDYRPALTWVPLKMSGALGTGPTY